MESVNGAEGVTASLAIVEVMLKRLRRCLDLNSDVGQPSSTPSIFTSNSSSSTQSNRRRLMADDESSKKSSVALILDAMFNGIRMERVVWQAWNVMIHAQCVLFTGAAAGSRPPALDLDLVVLILLFHHEPAQKAAERTLKKCVKAGFLTSGVVKSVFKSHAAVLSEYLKPIVKMANTLLQSGAYGTALTCVSCEGLIGASFQPSVVPISFLPQQLIRTPTSRPSSVPWWKKCLPLSTRHRSKISYSCSSWSLVTVTRLKRTAPSIF